MKDEMIQTIKDKVVRRLSEWVENRPEPDNPFIISTDGKPLTPQEILTEVRQESPLGIQFLASWVGLSMPTSESQKEDDKHLLAELQDEARR